MIRVQAGITRKRGLPRYSSAQATCMIDTEVESGLLQDAEQIAAAIRGLYRTCDAAVDDELNRIEEQTRRAEDPLERPASAAQVRAIQTLARRKRIDLAEFLKSQVQRVDTAGLTSVEASLVIDRLSAAA